MWPKCKKYNFKKYIINIRTYLANNHSLELTAINKIIYHIKCTVALDKEPPLISVISKCIKNTNSFLNAHFFLFT